jgi:hypothetical protein
VAARADPEIEMQRDATPGFGPMADSAIKSGTKALYTTAWKGHLDVARMLLEAGADKTKNTPWGTAAEFALKNGHEELARLLSQCSAKRSLILFGRSTLVYSCRGTYL